MARKLSETTKTAVQSESGQKWGPGSMSFDRALQAEMEARRHPCRTEAEWRDFWEFVEFHSFGDELEVEGRFEDLYDWCAEFWQPGWKTKGYNPNASW